jgi:NAD+ kinase
MASKIFAIFPNERKPHSINIATEICRFLNKQNACVVAEDQLCDTIGALALSEVDYKNIDFRICLGGDGTILRLVHRHPLLTAPLLGINLGSLGFLADIPQSDIFPSLQLLLDGNYTLQNRMKMNGRTSSEETCFAINEIVIHRAQNPCLIDLAIYVDGVYLNTFAADGIIISTPSGSTAYSLAAGGPILSPELRAFVLTPICPHTISNRPIVLMPKREIEVRYLSPLQPAEISYDGISSFALSTNETFSATVSDLDFCLANLANHDYFSTLREKLGWQGRLKTINPSYPEYSF